MEASGGTNIYEGLKTGLQRIKESSDSSTVVQPMIIFLTDGHATSGRVSTAFVFMTNIQRFYLSCSCIQIRIVYLRTNFEIAAVAV